MKRRNFIPHSLLVGLLLALTAAEVRAEVPTAARAAYGRGKAAYDSGSFPKAAREFAEADQLSPNPVVLGLAIAAALKAEEVVLGMNLVERAESRGLTQLAREGRDGFAPKTGSLAVACPGAKRCSATLDGENVVVGKPQWVRIGEHSVSLTSDDTTEQFTIRIDPARTTEVRPTRILQVRVASPEVMPPPAPAKTARLNPVWFWAAAGATVIAGGATVVSGLDATNVHDRFERGSKDEDTMNRGQSAETRTNVLLVTTAVLAAGSGALAWFVWRSGSRRSSAKPAIPFLGSIAF